MWSASDMEVRFLFYSNLNSSQTGQRRAPPPPPPHRVMNGGPTPPAKNYLAARMQQQRLGIDVPTSSGDERGATPTNGDTIEDAFDKPIAKRSFRTFPCNINL